VRLVTEHYSLNGAEEGTVPDQIESLYDGVQNCVHPAGVQVLSNSFSGSNVGVASDVPAGVTSDVPASVASDVPAGVDSDVTAGVNSDVNAGVSVRKPLFNGLIDIRAQRSRVYEVLECFRINSDELKTHYWDVLSPNVNVSDSEDDVIDTQLLDEASAYIDGAEYIRSSTFFRPSRSKTSMKFFKNIKTIIMLHCDRGMSLTSI
jgi:hypothetical protein